MDIESRSPELAEDVDLVVASDVSEKKSSAKEDSSFAVDSDIGDYQLLSLVHEGSNGKIFKVRHRRLNKQFALRVLDSRLLTNPLALERFQRELSVVSQFNHLNLVALYEDGATERGERYIVTDYVSGRSVRDVINADGSMSPLRVLNLALQLCDALIYLEERHVLVRDVRSSDLIITSGAGGVETLKIVDLGLARLFQGASESGSSDKGGDIDAFIRNSADAVNLIGVIIFEMLAGKRPDGFADFERISNAMASFKAPNLVLDSSEYKVNEGLQALVARTWAQRLDRIESLSELRQHLQALVSSDKPAKRSENKMAVPVIVCALLVTLLGAAGTAFFLSTKSEAPAPRKIEAVSVAPPVQEEYAQQIKDKFGRVLYSCNAPSPSAALLDAISHNANLAGAELQNITIEKMKIVETKLKGAHFVHCHFSQMQFGYANLEAARFESCDFRGVKFYNCAMNGVTFKRDKLDSVLVVDSHLGNSSFEKCTVSSAVGALDSGIRFEGSDLHDVNFSRGEWYFSQFLSPMPGAQASFHLVKSLISSDNMKNADFSKATIESSAISSPDIDSVRFKSTHNTKIERKVLN